MCIVADMALLKGLPADLQRDDRFVAGPQGPTNRSLTVSHTATIVSSDDDLRVGAVEVYWNERDEPSIFHRRNRIHFIRS